MKVLAVGDNRRYEELMLKLPTNINTTHFQFWNTVKPDSYDLIFDLDFDDHPGNLQYFARLQIPVICCAVKKRLSEAVVEYDHDILCQLIGMNLIPEFINRELTEISEYRNSGKIARQLMKQFSWNFKPVDDRVGMVTPRILFMLINEAFYTVQEGTASVKDIDAAMKLGTNYPHGPFEWVNKIGIKDIYETLNAIYLDTRDERYKICPLLKAKYLNRETKTG